MATLPRHRTVEDVMTTRVHVASPTTPFKILVRLIEENKVSAIPIVDQQGVPVGIVSEADLLLKERRAELESATNLLHLRRQARERSKAEGLVASDLMTSPPLNIGMDATLTQAARLMQERNIRRLIVVDTGGRIAGIVSRSDLLQVFLRSDEEIRDEIVTKIVPTVTMDQINEVGVEVRYNVVTLHGEVDRKSDAEIVGRLSEELDGVVDVVNLLSYRWDDGTVQPASALRGGNRSNAI